MCVVFKKHGQRSIEHAVQHPELCREVKEELIELEAGTLDAIIEAIGPGTYLERVRTLRWHDLPPTISEVPHANDCLHKIVPPPPGERPRLPCLVDLHTDGMPITVRHISAAPLLVFMF
jgi:hypothetical protein